MQFFDGPLLSIVTTVTFTELLYLLLYCSRHLCSLTCLTLESGIHSLCCYTNLIIFIRFFKVVWSNVPYLAWTLRSEVSAPLVHSISFKMCLSGWITAQLLEGWSNVDLSVADVRSTYKVLYSPSPRKRPLLGLVLQACLSAVVCQVKAVLYLVKGQLSSLPPISAHTCFPASQVCLWWAGLCVQVRHGDPTLHGIFR